MNAIITGATDGIGKATAEGLVSRGYDLIIPCRNLDKGEKTRMDLLKINPKATVDIIFCDLAEQKSIKGFANQVKEQYRSVDVLINNAGVINNKLIKTSDGIENTFAVNVLAQVMLSHLLLELIEKSEHGRIINVTSDSYKGVKLIDFNNLNGAIKFSTMNSYSYSALARILNTKHMAGLFAASNITVNCLHPGAINTNIGNNNKGIDIAVFNMVRPFLKKPKKGAETSIFLATSPSVNNQSGRYFINSKIVETTPIANDLALAKKMWETCLKLLQL